MAAKNLFLFFFVATLIVCDGAPKRSKQGNGPHTVYDQQQTGDYNIQVHLKDFQIIALLGDEAAGLGDYDYSYDYSDFTIKPNPNKPTEQPSGSSTSSSSSFKPPGIIPTSRPPYQPYPFVTTGTNAPIAIKPAKPDEKPVSPEKPVVIETAVASEKPVFSEKPSALPEKPIFIEKPTSTEKPAASESSTVTSKPSSTEKQPENPENSPVTQKPETSSSANAVTTSNLPSTQKSPKLDDGGSGGKIKVQIIETPVRMSVVPGEDAEQNETYPQGEILQLRRCASGFTRDKRGRCRRVRKPTGTITSQIPFGFGRLASNLASRFRQSEESSSSSSESKEN